MRSPYDNSDDFRKDRYGDHVESTKRYFEKRDELIKQISPIEGEMLHGRIQRLQNIAHNWEEVNTASHIYGRKIWFTHKNPSSCWLCDGIIIINTVIEEMSYMYDFMPNGQYMMYTKHPEFPEKLVLVDRSKDMK